MRRLFLLFIVFCFISVLFCVFSVNVSHPAHGDLGSQIRDEGVAESSPSPKVIVSFLPQGGLGNVICEYVHLLHTNITFSMEAYVHPKMHLILSRLFLSFPLPLLPASYLAQMEHHRVDYHNASSLLRGGSPLPLYTLLTSTPCDVPRILSIRNYWKDKLTLQPQLKVAAEKRIGKIMQENIRNWPVKDTKAVVGVHVRRGDFVSVLHRHLGHQELLPPAFYHSAFNHFRHRFGREVVFVIFAEEKIRAWCREFLSSPLDDVIVVDDDANAEQDLVQLSMFEHIVYSHGTFGLWAILLSDARTVVYPDKSTDIGSKRYAIHGDLDRYNGSIPGTEFVTVLF